jgi:hypothetical protein
MLSLGHLLTFIIDINYSIRLFNKNLFKLNYLINQLFIKKHHFLYLSIKDDNLFDKSFLRFADF